MKYLLTILIISVLSCNSNNSSLSNIEEGAKQYMKDSVVPKFNDPGSYEFVSLKIDTLKGGEYVSSLQSSLNAEDTTALGKEFYERDKNTIAKIQSNPRYKDSILHLNIDVQYRGKNKMGGLVLDNISLVYLPEDKRITLLENIVPKY